MAARSLLIARLALVLAACGPALSGCHSPNGPSAPPAPPVLALALACPSDIEVLDVKTPTQVFSYSPPTYSGGVEPIAVTCSPASGAAFAAGATTVTCSGTDAATPAGAAACTFNVTLVPYVPPTPVLAVTDFWAFGDSITLGENGCDDFCVFSREPLDAYPAVLQGLLSARYSQQQVTVSPSGRGGETAVDGARRLAIELAEAVPGALLLLEGVNDLHPSSGGTPTSVANALGDAVREAKARGVTKIFLATLPPEIPDGPRSRAWGIPPMASSDLVGETNAMIRDLARNEGVVLVDAFAALNANLHGTIADPEKQASDGEYGDGLHLTRVGMAALAQAFFEAIQANAGTATQAARAPERSAFPGLHIQIGPPADRQPIGIRRRQQ